ncbi:tRNA adenosine(34) deaminase TadA [Bermanella sp. R86510]|uniref:tRNA adenosine(34) deaminase TadA n=1 Tax=unclassified Bermanella TaxID=2627862 RepID=UPI0037CC6122
MYTVGSDEYFMAAALQQAKLADVRDEVPVGAVVVLDGEIIGRGFNQPITGCDPTAHAEIMALRNAAQHISNYRLVDADLFVTIEPCTMCAGAIVHSRIKRVIFGATEPKAGVACSQQAIFEAPYFNHTVEVTGGVLAEECTQQVQAFFKRRREEKKAQKIHSNNDSDTK